ncbi:MAG: hypothetical protein AB3N17_12480 [Tateyamaria sp.]
MKVYFQADDAALPARAGLLLQTLKAHFGPRAENGEALEIVEETGAARLDLLLGLSGLAPSHTSDTTLFFGLGCAPGQMLGENYLVCLRPLTDELLDFEARFPDLAESGPHWCIDVLRNFRRCIFVNESDLRASVGFSPWISLGLAGNVPVSLPRRRLSEESDTLQVAIFVHDLDCLEDGRQIMDTLPDTVRAHLVVPSDPVETVRAHASSAIHVHCGYTEAQATPLISPFDSVVNGNYCKVLGLPSDLNAVLRQLFELRSYTQTYATPVETAKACWQTHEKLRGLREAGLRFNPEIKRFETANQQFFETSIQRLEEQLT